MHRRRYSSTFHSFWSYLFPSPVFILCKLFLGSTINFPRNNWPILPEKETTVRDWDERFGYWEKGRYSPSPPCNKVCFFMSKGSSYQFPDHAPLIFFIRSEIFFFPFPIHYCTHWMVYLVVQKQRLRLKAKQSQNHKAKIKKRVAKCQNMFWKNSLSLSILLSVFISGLGSRACQWECVTWQIRCDDTSLGFLGLS